MDDGGLVRGYVGKFQALATKAQRGKLSDDELAALIEETKHAAGAWEGGAAKDQLLKSIAGQLRMDAAASEKPDPRLPDKLTDQTLNLAARIAALRKAADALSPK